MHEDLAHVEFVHDLIETPKYRLLVVLNIKKKDGYDVVHALHVTYFLVKVSESNQNIVKFIVTAE